MNRIQLELSRAFIKIFVRDRQSLFFNLFMPFFFLALLGSIYGGNGDRSFDVGVVDEAGSDLSIRFIDSLSAMPGVDLTIGSESELTNEIEQGRLVLVLIVPPQFAAAEEGVTLRVKFDGRRLILANMARQLLAQVLVDIERDLRGSVPMFELAMEDVQSRSTSYVDFLLPGILALSIMQTSIAGSGFNTVEYRRRGILKRLFVTPITALDFIVAMCASRMLLIVAQVAVLSIIGVGVMGATVSGSVVLMLAVVLMGIVLFLAMGFGIGGVAKTQDSVGVIGNLVIFPQMFLSGVFFPVEAMPAFVQPVVSFLPLAFLVDCMRDIAVNGAGLIDILPGLVGVIVWLVLCLALASRVFVWRDISQYR